MSESKAFEVRITQLEETVLHQERLVQQLNEIVIQLRAGLEKMEAENEEPAKANDLSDRYANPVR